MLSDLRLGPYAQGEGLYPQGLMALGRIRNIMSPSPDGRGGGSSILKAGWGSKMGD